MDNNKTNNDPNRLITVAIHTFDRAVEKLRPEEFADLARRLQMALEI